MFFEACLGDVDWGGNLDAALTGEFSPNKGIHHKHLKINSRAMVGSGNPREILTSPKVLTTLLSVTADGACTHPEMRGSQTSDRH